MPRSSSSSSRSSSKPAVSRPVTQLSRPPAPTIQHNVKVEQPGFFSNIWQGFGLGSGQAIAHNIFRSDPVVKHVHEDVPVKTNELPKEFVQCMKDNQNNTELCKQFLK